MSVSLRIIMDALEAIAPLRLAEGWDNVGLMVGSPEQIVQNVLVAVDLTAAVLAQAEKTGANLIITHHPFIFSPLKSIRTDSAGGSLLARLIKADIAVYSAHTNLDAAVGGVSDVLAGKLGLTDVRPLVADTGEKLIKLAVFVPESHLEAVAQAITAAGAGHIGNYSHCTFRSAGMGTFMPLEGTNPFTGVQGRLEYTPECRLETIMPAAEAKRVVAAMIKAHPYEEVAYDLYPLENKIAFAGLGRVGTLPAKVMFDELVEAVKAVLALEVVRVAGAVSGPVKTVAVCGGAGGSFIRKAYEAGADCFVTGDIKYHEAQEAVELGIAVIDAGHFATEQPVVSSLVARLNEWARHGGWEINIQADQISRDIIRSV